MSNQTDSSWSVREVFTVDDAHPDSTSFDSSLPKGRLNVRFRVWRLAFITFGVITSILVVAAFIGLFITQPTVTRPPAILTPSPTVTSPLTGVGAPAPGTASSSGTASPSSGTAASPSSGTAASPSSQTAQTLAVAGLIIGCISAIGTLLSGWATLVTARAVARQDMASRTPRARAKSSKPRTRMV
jgi:hypothetical protein